MFRSYFIKKRVFVWGRGVGFPREWRGDRITSPCCWRAPNEDQDKWGQNNLIKVPHIPRNNSLYWCKPAKMNAFYYVLVANTGEGLLVVFSFKCRLGNRDFIIFLLLLQTPLLPLHAISSLLQGIKFRIRERHCLRWSPIGSHFCLGVKILISVRMWGTATCIVTN